MHTFSRFVPFVAIVLATYLVACSGSDPVEPPPGGTGSANILPVKQLDGTRIRPEIVGASPVGDLQTTFDVEWSDEVTILAEEDVLMLQQDTRTGFYYLPSSMPSAQSLQQGDIVIFTGVGFRRIDGVRTENDEIELRTSQALLTDAITNGVISFEFRPDFDGAAPPMIEHDGAPASAGKFAYNPAATISTKLAKFDFSLEVGCTTPDELSVTVTGKDPSGLTEFKVGGSVSEFTGKGEFRIVDRELSVFSYLIRDVDAEIFTEMTVGNEPIVLETGYLPVTLFRFPFLLGPLPMQLKFPLGFAASAQIPIGGKVRAKSSTIYNVDIGYIFEAPATITPIYVDKGSAQTKEETEFIPNAAGFAEYAIAFPRVEWSFVGLDDIAYYVHLAYLLRGSYSQNDLAGNTCKDAKRTFAGVGGFFADLFGLAEGERFVQIFAVDDLFYSEGCD